MSQPAPTHSPPGKHRITIGLWWLALYLLILYLAVRFGGHPGPPDQRWITS